jgi:hypothetical protein
LRIGDEGRQVLGMMLGCEMGALQAAIKGVRNMEGPF